MRSKHIYWLFIFFFFEQQYLLSMENTSASEQKMIKVRCSDNKNYLLEQWKIFESIPFHMYYWEHYSRSQSINTVIKLPLTINISYEKMDLFSKALDKALLSKTVGVVSEEFKQYFRDLTPQKRRLLIIASGRFDENGKKQLNSPMLTAQLVDVYFDFEKDFLKKHIKPLLQRDELEEYYISKIINYNLGGLHCQNISYSDPYVIHSNEQGRMSKVPVCLAVEGATRDNLVSAFIDQKCVDNVLRRVFYSKKIEDWHYYVTNVDQQQEKLGNGVLLWSINNNKKICTTINVSNNHDIAKFNGLSTRCYFNKDGTCFVVWSINDVFVTKILRQDDGSSLFNTYQICRDVVNIIDIKFYNDDTQLVVCSFDDIKKSNGKFYLFNIMGEHIKSAVVNGLPYTSTENREGLLLFCYLDKNDFLIKNCCALINDNMEICQKMIYTKSFDQVICSPDKNHCAMLAKDGAVSLITVGKTISHVRNLSSGCNLVSKNKKKMLFSSDSRSLIVLGLYKEYIIDVWSTVTGEKRSSVKISSSIIDLKKILDSQLKFTFGLTPENHDLILYAANYHRMYKVPFFSQQDQKDMCVLNDVSVSLLTVLRRLYVANKNGNEILLYEEEPAYKILQALNKPNFIKKCLCFNVINNNKNMVSLLCDKGFGLIQKLWK